MNGGRDALDALVVDAHVVDNDGPASPEAAPLVQRLQRLVVNDVLSLEHGAERLLGLAVVGLCFRSCH